MFLQLLSIFFDVLIPVFLLVTLGYFVGPPLEIQTKTLSRYIFNILNPAFVFLVLSSTTIEISIVIRMTAYIVVVHIGCAIAGYSLAKFLRRPPQMIAAYILVTVFGNVGNFGLPITQFALGEDALASATIYFLVILVVAFVVGVAAANWDKGTRFEAVLAVLKTPSLIVVPPAILCNWLQLELPLTILRPIEILSGALIPTMLIMLGVQLAETGIPRLSFDMFAASSIRLIVGPLLAVLVAIPMGVEGASRSAGILQAAMPVAVLTSIIATENDLLPGFVMGTILVSTLLSIVSLTLVIAFVQ